MREEKRSDEKSDDVVDLDEVAYVARMRRMAAEGGQTNCAMEDDDRWPFKAKKGRSGSGERWCILSSPKAKQELLLDNRDIDRVCIK